MRKIFCFICPWLKIPLINTNDNFLCERYGFLKTKNCLVSTSFLICLLSFLICSTDCLFAQQIGLVPAPLQIEKEDGFFQITEQTVISVENEEQEDVASDFADLFTVPAGFTPMIEIGLQNAAISLVTDKALKKEAYRLTVSEDSIRIYASDVKGFFYAFQTLRLLLPSEIEGRTLANQEWKLPVFHMEDEPRFGYRSLMLDVARCFIPKEEVLRILDCMALLKLNTLHMHLSDDTGWRLEIKKYPRLTEVGAWRVDRGRLPFYARRNQAQGEKTTLGGFYTQEDMEEIVAYAADRQINVIPEIDVPAHSCAALAAYPELACPVVKEKITVLPGLGGRNPEMIYCAGNEKVFAFLQDVIDELLQLFPSPYINMGGDEATKTYWKTCPLCQKRMQEEHLKEVEDLQGYFMGRLNEYIRSKGRTMMGWDELTNSKLPEKAVILGWQGLGNAALKAADQGLNFVMTPARVLYLIRYQGPQWFEPLTYFGNNTLRDVYNYEPVQTDWKPEYENLLLGVQASMWTEFCYDADDVMYMLFPRLAALAEVAWSQKGKKNWEGFQRGLDNYLAHLEKKNVPYASSMYNIQHTVVPEEGKLCVKLHCERTDAEIRYTLDGREPDMYSSVYTTPLKLDAGTVVKCASFVKEMRKGEILTLPLLNNKVTGKHVLSKNPMAYLLTNGVRGSLRQSDFEWCTWDNLNAASFTIDLQQAESVQQVLLGCLTNYGMAVHKPKRITVEVSKDNRTFVLVGQKEFSEAEIFRDGNYVEDVEFTFKTRKVRYVRITAEGFGPCPESHYMRPGQPARYYFDELQIR